MTAFVVGKNWTNMPSTSGSYGRLLYRDNTSGFQNFQNSLQVKLLGNLLPLVKCKVIIVIEIHI